ncbi:MAG: FtsX-like permease family protein [Bernardetiaceae bacterium]
MQTTPLTIARRYFFSRKKKQFIHVLTNLSMLVVAVGTMALIVVLSTFNGLETLTRGLHTAHNPDLKVVPARGKTLTLHPEEYARIQTTEGVATLTEVIEDNALLRYGSGQSVVKIKGVSPNFGEQYPLGQYLKEGVFALQNAEGEARALIGMGVQYQLAISLHGTPTPLVLWYPSRNKKISVADPSKNFRRFPIYPAGVLAVEQQFDERYVLVPLDFARQLTGYDSAVSFLEIRVLGKVSEVQKNLQAYLGDRARVLNSDQQQESILRAFKIERLFAFLAFACIIAVASFNIFFSLAMLVIEKRRDISILKALGADTHFVQAIFLWETGIIAGLGTGLGLLLGFLLVLSQEVFGWVSLGIETAIVSAYPVELRWGDFVWTGLVVLLITLSAGILPARRAGRIRD